VNVFRHAITLAFTHLPSAPPVNGVGWLPQDPESVDPTQKGLIFIPPKDDGKKEEFGNGKAS